MSATIRVGVTSNKGAKKPQAEAIGTVTTPVDYKTLLKFCKSKLKIKTSDVRIFVCRGSPAVPVGYEITEGNTKIRCCLTGDSQNSTDYNSESQGLPLDVILCDDILLAVSTKGADYNNAGQATGNSFKQQMGLANSKLGLPPRSFAVWYGKTWTGTETISGTENNVREVGGKLEGELEKEEAEEVGEGLEAADSVYANRVCDAKGDVAYGSGSDKVVVENFVVKEQGIENVSAENAWCAVLSSCLEVGHGDADATGGTNTDDLTTAIVSELRGAEEKLRFLAFVKYVNAAVGQLVKDYCDWAADAFRATGNAEVVCAFANSWKAGGSWGSAKMDDSQTCPFPWSTDLTRAAIRKDASNVHRLLQSSLVNLAKKSEVVGVEALLGIRWSADEVSQQSESESIVDYLPLDNFSLLDPCPDDSIVNHVCNVYAPRKIANLTGDADLGEDSYLHLPRDYSPAEGKITGLWEQFKKIDVWDLRVDLQGMCREGPTPHEGSPEYGLLMVQYGLSTMIGQSNAKNYPKGDIAAVFVPTGIDVPVRHIIGGLRKSFETQKMVMLGRRLDHVDVRKFAVVPNVGDVVSAGNQEFDNTTVQCGDTGAPGDVVSVT